MELTEEIKPIYLGYAEAEHKYFFYFIKQGAPRFLAYVSYFFWDKGPQTILSLAPIPEEVERELGQFLSGELDYEFIKKRKNSKELSARKVYRTPQQVTNNDCSTNSPNNGTRRNGGGRVVGRYSSAERVETPTANVSVLKEEVEPVRRKRRTKAEVQELKKLQQDKVVVEVVAITGATVNVRPKRKYTRKPKP